MRVAKWAIKLPTVRAIFTASLLFSSASSAESAVPNFDSDLVKLYSAIEDGEQAKTSNPDSAQTSNRRLESYLLENASSLTLMHSALPKSKRRLWVVESSDHLFRIYSWDMLTGGKIHSYGGVAQYRADVAVKGEKFPENSTEPEGGYYYPEIKTFKTKSGGTIYVASGVSIQSQTNFGGTVAAYSINNGKLQKVQFFKPSRVSDKLLDTISFDYQPEPGEVAGIDFEDHNRIMRVPLIDKKRSDTGGWLNYKFDGERFVYSGSSSASE